VIDTARIIITEKCNFSCSYCCNNLPEVRERFTPITYLDEMPWGNYEKVCISGGEPLLNMQRLAAVLVRAFPRPVYLYTNGYYLTPALRDTLLSPPLGMGLAGITVGLHLPTELTNLACFVHPKVRVSAMEHQYELIPAILRNDNLKLARLNECDTPNEHIYLWKESA
jgi:MoaA/NifB/PqqE/SkfB family radical SAM enzyme